MRVLVLTTDLNSTGGIQRYTQTLVRALEELYGAENVQTVVVRERQGGRGRLGVRIKAGFVVKALREARRWRPGLVVCAHVALAPLGWMVRRLVGCPYFTITHGIEVWGNLPWWKREPLRRSSRILTVSDFTRNTLVKRHSIDSQCITLLPPVLESHLTTVKADVQEILQRWNLDGRRIVLTVGRLASEECYKGHDVVIQALPSVLQHIPDVVYLIVGDGDDRDRLAQLARSLGLVVSSAPQPLCHSSAVYFAGRVSDAELAACYQACDVFVLPARTVVDDHAPKGEGFGIVFLEAMAFGKSVIGPNYGAPTEFIRHGEHGLLVDPGSPEEIAEALIALLIWPDLARRMGKAGREWVRQEFSFERFKERMEHILGKWETKERRNSRK